MGTIGRKKGACIQRSENFVVLLNTACKVKRSIRVIVKLNQRIF